MNSPERSGQFAQDAVGLRGFVGLAHCEHALCLIAARIALSIVSTVQSFHCAADGQPRDEQRFQHIIETAKALSLIAADVLIKCPKR
jgi:hypothetical protein